MKYIDKEEKLEQKTEKVKCKIRINAVKFKVTNPKTKTVETYFKGDIIEKPWPDLIKLAESDTGHRSLSILT